MQTTRKKPASDKKSHKEKPSLNVKAALSQVIWPKAGERSRIKDNLTPEQCTPRSEPSATTPPTPARNPASISVCALHHNQAPPIPIRNPARLLVHELQGHSTNSHRLIATTLFEDTESLDNTHFENTRPEDTQLTYTQPEEPQAETSQREETQDDCSSTPSEMASSRFSTFIDPRFSRLPEQHPFRSYVRREAREQQAVIHKRLEAAGEPIPPYEWLEFIGKGSYGRVYVA